MAEVNAVQVTKNLLLHLDKVERHNEKLVRHMREPARLTRRQDLAWEIWERVEQLDKQGAVDLDTYTEALLARLRRLAEEGNGPMLEVEWSDQAWADLSDWRDEQDWLQLILPHPDYRMDAAIEAECADDLTFHAHFEVEDYSDATAFWVFSDLITFSGLREMDELDWQSCCSDRPPLVERTDEDSLVWLPVEVEAPPLAQGRLPRGDSRHGQVLTFTLGLCTCEMCFSAHLLALEVEDRMRTDTKRELRAFCAHGTLPDCWEPKP